MTPARYLLAKYIPDLRRGEPRNVGVVLWSEAGVAARFLAEKPGHPGEVFLKRIPSFVASRESYRQWVEFWHGQIRLAELTDRRNPGVAVSRSDPAYLDVLAAKGRGNYVLAPAGQFLDPVSDPSDAVNFLFRTLVEVPDAPSARTLDSVCDSLIERFHLKSDRNFKKSFPVRYELPGGVETELEFSYAYQNGALHRLYQRVPFSEARGRLKSAVNNTALKFERVTSRGLVEKSGAVSLVYLPPDAKPTDDDEHLIRVLGTVSRVVNVGRDEEATREFTGLAALASH